MVTSPCIDVCVIDNGTGWCLGCFRTLDEIAAWGAISDAEKQAVLDRLPERRRAAGDPGGDRPSGCD